jgi:ribosomal protein S18 acetylase RimI-like enzyme
VIEYRTFRNTDPPGLAAIWNESFTGRGAVQLRHSMPLETFVFSKPYFDPAGLVIAWDGANPVGFAHSGFGSDAVGSALSKANGVICAIGVLPAYRRRGIGTELLMHSERYLWSNGAQRLVAGPRAPVDPFYFSLYGGSKLPGFLASDAEAEPFLGRHAYKAQEKTLILQRELGAKVDQADGRFAALRRQFDVRIVPRGGKMSWWQECVVGPVEPVDFQLEEKGTGRMVARVCLWEMESFGSRWSQSSVGIMDVEVIPELRRRGVAKYLLLQTMRYLQDQYFALTEVQVPATNAEALAFFQDSGFTQVDVGKFYVK